MATKQVSQTNLTPTYGNIAKRDVLATFDKATELQAIFESPAFADARAYLGTSNNDFSGVGATADVQAQLGVLRTLSLFAAEKTIAGTGIPFQNRLLRDPVTGNRVFFTGGSDPTKQAVLISAPAGKAAG